MRYYRGKTKEGKWVYGWLFISPAFPSMPFILEPKKKQADYFRDYPHGWDVKDLFKAYKVIPETVGQSIGRKDKSQEESFFGDLIKIYDQIFEIKWDEKMGRVFLYGDGIDENDILYLYGSDITNGEIIGNIHKTPRIIQTERRKSWKENSRKSR